jgi:hypothetical protein
MFASPLLRSKKEVLDTADPRASSYSRSRSEHPRQRSRRQGPLDPVAEEGGGENEVVQPANPAANAAANALANTAANALANAPANAVDNIVNNAANAANI